MRVSFDGGVPTRGQPSAPSAVENPHATGLLAAQTSDRAARARPERARKMGSQPISRVLSRTVIPLGSPSLTTSSNLPESSAGHTDGFLFGLAPSGVYHATDCYQLRGALLPHLFTLTGACALRRFAFCCTFRRLAPPRRYLALYPVEPGLSSMTVLAHHHSDCPANSRRQE